MPAIAALAYSSAVTIGRALAALATRARRGIKLFAKRLQDRRDVTQLAEFDDRMLRDIGLTRGDVRDAFSGPPWRDPADMLAQRAAERRIMQQRAKPVCATADRPPSPLFTAPPVRCYPPADRSARYLM
jgi:uncharacterized protein YjiS (DUF1127 family)